MIRNNKRLTEIELEGSSTDSYDQTRRSLVRPLWALPCGEPYFFSSNEWKLVNWLFSLFIVTVLFSACKTHSTMQNTATVAFRLKPGEDLRQSIEKIVAEKQIKAGWIATGVGSLTNYNIRFANQPDGSADSGHFEIVSLTGTVSTNGSHIHISISDSTGKTIGGHLLDGCKVYTTAEIVIQSSNSYEFTRQKDGSTPWEELQVKELKVKNEE